MSEISALVPLQCDSRELPDPFHHKRTQKLAVYDLEEVLTRSPPYLHPDLRLPTSRTVRNKFLWFTSPPVAGVFFVRAAQTDYDSLYEVLPKFVCVCVYVCVCVLAAPGLSCGVWDLVP